MTAHSSGHFAAAAHPQPAESDVGEAERGITELPALSAPIDRAVADRAVESAVAEQPGKAESLEQMKDSAKRIKDLFEKLHTKENACHTFDGSLPPTATRPNTPTSTYSTSSGRTPPWNNGSEHRGGDRTAGSSSAQSNRAAVASTSRSDNVRENVLQMWSYFGSTLQEVVHRNEALEEENRRLRMDLATLQQRVTDAQQTLASSLPAANSCGPFSES
mmetsp:Transcript_9155/g.21373  ORF Transcript_9155/g.21373 Transcript_9155/m.21373 type:complete len:218 (+) Transcript_9155:89-742(+)|eukprot:CAMPEP_0171105276 /NCGR_PEP_ID=MMETSP0766_2-20121228/62298_1 /TAXON_ID=439317 /ORGANISM="Gambierdiscus australes, Strain CAWD 149" /LENGTH=217 /DNA_ID=CAMNT_0011566071 /DNA_START=86 /DNA_END=739 /DNA_ORIENTATION=+